LFKKSSKLSEVGPIPFSFPASFTMNVQIVLVSVELKAVVTFEKLNWLNRLIVVEQIGQLDRYFRCRCMLHSVGDNLFGFNFVIFHNRFGYVEVCNEKTNESMLMITSMIRKS